MKRKLVDTVLDTLTFLSPGFEDTLLWPWRRKRKKSDVAEQPNRLDHEAATGRWKMEKKSEEWAWKACGPLSSLRRGINQEGRRVIHIPCWSTLKWILLESTREMGASKDRRAWWRTRRHPANLNTFWQTCVFWSQAAPKRKCSADQALSSVNEPTQPPNWTEELTFRPSSFERPAHSHWVQIQLDPEKMVFCRTKKIK